MVAPEMNPFKMECLENLGGKRVTNDLISCLVSSFVALLSNEPFL